MISLTTQCPHCQARFATSALELQRRKGYVRCVECAHIFDGYEYIVGDEVPTHSSAAPATTASPVAPATTASPVAPATTASTAPMAPSLPVDAASTAQPLVTTSEPAEPFFSIEPTGIAKPSAEPFISTEPGTIAEPTRVPFAPPGPKQFEDLPDGWSARTAAGTADGIIEDDDVPSRRRPYRLPVVAAEAEPTMNFDGGDLGAANEPEMEHFTAIYAERRFKPADFSWRYRLKRVLGRALIILLVLLALMQTVYVFRAQIALYAPFTRPALQSLCAQLGCTVPFLRAANAIQVTQSRLLVQQPPITGITDGAVQGVANAQAHYYLLEIGLRNTAPVPQEWPTIFVTFNDAAATVLGRFEVFPADYLSGIQLNGPFLPGQTVNVRLQVVAKDKKINGFKIEKFFS